MLLEILLVAYFGTCSVFTFMFMFDCMTDNGFRRDVKRDGIIKWILMIWCWPALVLVDVIKKLLR